jgi:hypothetical protein
VTLASTDKTGVNISIISLCVINISSSIKNQLLNVKKTENSQQKVEEGDKHDKKMLSYGLICPLLSHQY